MFARILNRWKMRTHCSCGALARQIDDTTFECTSGCGVFDGAADFEQKKVLIREKDTVIDRI